LDATGVTTWAGQQLIVRAGQSRVRILVLMMLMCALLTAAISVNAVAALLPVVVLMGHRASVIVSEAAEDAGVGSFGYLEFALAGIPLLGGTIAVVALLAPRLLLIATPVPCPATSAITPGRCRSSTRSTS
jgi:hypothetical protein